MPPVQLRRGGETPPAVFSCPIAPPSGTLHPSSTSRDCVVFQKQNIEHTAVLQNPRTHLPTLKRLCQQSEAYYVLVHGSQKVAAYQALDHNGLSKFFDASCGRSRLFVHRASGGPIWYKRCGGQSDIPNWLQHGPDRHSATLQPYHPFRKLYTNVFHRYETSMANTAAICRPFITIARSARPSSTGSTAEHSQESRQR